VETEVNTGLRGVWTALLQYEVWNPTFADATVVPITGGYRSEGEIVLIKKRGVDQAGTSIPEFYAETVKIIPFSRICWYVHPKDGESFRNFVDFGLSEIPSGVRFSINYYEQSLLTGEQLAQHRRESTLSFPELAAAYKAYCESLT
jgi:hypothetical protein